MQTQTKMNNINLILSDVNQVKMRDIQPVKLNKTSNASTKENTGGKVSIS